MTMTPVSRRVLVTGGAGFIGSAVCRHFIARGHQVCNIDKLTYAANLDSLAPVVDSPNYQFAQLDICDRRALRDVFDHFAPDVVLHLAAESHVDRSISDASVFIQTNVVGTVALLDEALDYWTKRGKPDDFRFHHVSTDEVYGDLPIEGTPFTEQTRYQPSSPYAASKAASDFMVMSWFRTFGLPVVLSNCSNNYGAYQNIEKLIPHMIVTALQRRPLPIYGNGSNIRDWLHVDDHVAALELVMSSGRPGERYNIGGNNEHSNLDVVRTICVLLDQKAPHAEGSYLDLMSFVSDRPGHDFRYAVDATKAITELGWSPRHDFASGLTATVGWYLANVWWWSKVAKTD